MAPTTVGSTRDNLETRIAQHQAGGFNGYTALRRPVTLVFHHHFERVEDAIAAERQVSGLATTKEGGTDARRLCGNARPVPASFETRSCGALLRMR
jgi:hypothetical protein